MRIEPNAHVTLDYTLRDEAGAVLDASDRPGGEPIVYVHGYGMLVPGLEAGLAGLAEGEEREILVVPEEGFGERDEALVMEVDLAGLPEQRGMVAGDELLLDGGDGEEVAMRVLEVRSDAVVVDANHPLAGLTLRYSVKARRVRQSTRAEIEAAAGELDASLEAGLVEPTGGHELVILRRKSD